MKKFDWLYGVANVISIAITIALLSVFVWMICQVIKILVVRV